MDKNKDEIITMVHGSGGSATGRLIREIFARDFDNQVLSAMEDAALVEGHERLAVTTDSFVVDPLEFPGGDIGRLAVCGTVNDLLMRGARPRYLTCGYILEEGLPVDTLARISHSMADAAAEAGVKIVAGDTKVIQGSGGLYINTSGVGFVDPGLDISAGRARPGDAIIVSGTMGDHHAAILGQRLDLTTSIVSDCAPLGAMVMALLEAGIPVHSLRDITRGGLATVCKELAEASGQEFILEDRLIPVRASVRDFCGLLGLDYLYMGNEGKLLAILPGQYAGQALALIRSCPYGKDAAVIGQVAEPRPGDEGSLTLVTSLGGRRRLSVMSGEGLPRIC